MNPCILSLFAICFYFLFSFRVKLSTTMDTQAVFPPHSVLYCKTSLLPHVLKKQTENWFQNCILHPSSTGILLLRSSHSGVKKLRHRVEGAHGFEMDRSLNPWTVCPRPSWRWHFTLHMKTRILHCLCVTYTPPLHDKMWQKHSVQKKIHLSSVLISLSDQTERERECEGRKESTHESVTI